MLTCGAAEAAAAEMLFGGGVAAEDDRAGAADAGLCMGAGRGG